MLQTNGAGLGSPAQSLPDSLRRAADAVREGSARDVVGRVEEPVSRPVHPAEPRRDGARLIDLERRAKFGRFG